MPKNESSTMELMESFVPSVDNDGCIVNLGYKVRTSTKTAAYTVLVSDSGTRFSNAGAVGSVTFTLPAVASSTGCEYWFFNAVEAQDIVVAAPTGTLVAYNDITADSITLASLPGTCVHVFCDGTKWYSGVGLSKIDITITVA